MLQTELFELRKNERNLVLLETVVRDVENTKSLLFVNPVEIISTSTISELPSMFEKMENALRRGYYLAGFVTYECGFHFLELPNVEHSHTPIVWFGVYEDPTSFLSSPLTAHHSPLTIHDSRFTIHKTNEPATLEDYSPKIEKIKWHIQEGDVYQINYTGRVKFDVEEDAVSLYESLKQKQRVSYASFIKTEQQTILSLSPELFFRRQGNRIAVRPMKGTVKRGRTTKEDAELVEWLKNDEKSQAENVMIVDVLRNDLGKISKQGSVRTTSLFDVEKYDTLFQMVSNVEAELRDDVRYYELFKAMFPSGSVTGAPKRRAVELIHELEESPRGIYTGAIGFISPKKEAVFNVAIRTVVLETNPIDCHSESALADEESRPSITIEDSLPRQVSSQNDKLVQGTMGTGGGIVWDSNAESEFNECKLKAKFLTIPFEKFRLIETVLWKDGFPLLEKHLSRLRDSAEYFQFRYDEEEIRERFQVSGSGFQKLQSYKVRLLVSRSGEIEIESSIIQIETSNNNVVAIAFERTNSADRFLFHKTTNRTTYDKWFEKAKDEGLADLIFLNEKNEVTEGCISNVFIKKGDVLYTPPIECGLLNGVYRQYLLEKLPNVTERVLFVEDLKRADSIYISNAIRGLREVHLTERVERTSETKIKAST
ncbi:MAG: chorismate-binding protein [Ignavibacteriae bacterium]|nr:chorismate-binding protein [Ignavibacteriota bacterium]